LDQLRIAGGARFCSTPQEMYFASPPAWSEPVPIARLRQGPKGRSSHG